MSAGFDSSFSERVNRYFNSVIDAAAETLKNPSDGIFELVPSAIFRLIPHFALGREPLDIAPLPGALSRIAERRDCADFVLAGIQRILRLYSASPMMPSDLRESFVKAEQNFAFWYDQPGIAGMCFHTENHQILFHACEILAGEAYPDLVFPNSGKSGKWHAEHGTKMAVRWMDERARFGFVEWLSCYYEEDILALLNIYDFARDPELKRRAEMLTDMILLEIAMHSHHGVLGTTHGRTYAEYIKGGANDPVSAISWLVFGEGVFIDRSNLALTTLATSAYRSPKIIYDIFYDTPAERTSRQRVGVTHDEALKFGSDANKVSDQMLFWADQTARHPDSRKTARALGEIASDKWLIGFIDTVDGPLETTRQVAESGGAAFDGDAVNTALAPANLYLYKTPDYILSCAQDFRPGKPGYQQHPWQATLSMDAVVFTNHPGNASESSGHGDRPNFWAGNRVLPRAAQYENVLICIHHVLPCDPFPFSHAYFPIAAFDEIIQSGNCTFARKGDGYLALYSQTTPSWEGKIELRALSPDNIWICEVGNKAQNGSFEEFIVGISGASVQSDGLSVVYESPSVGEMRFGWTGPLLVESREIPLSNYPRFDNPLIKAEIGDMCYTVNHNDTSLTWDFSR